MVLNLCTIANELLNFHAEALRNRSDPQRAGGLRPHFDRLEVAFSGIDYEMVIVDDGSPGATCALDRFLARHNRLRLLDRIGGEKALHGCRGRGSVNKFTVHHGHGCRRAA